MNEKLITCKENQIAKILLKIENHLDNLHEQGKLECFDKIDIIDMLYEINEVL